MATSLLVLRHNVGRRIDGPYVIGAMSTSVNFSDPLHAVQLAGRGMDGFGLTLLNKASSR